jgi:HCaRG protein.
MDEQKKKVFYTVNNWFRELMIEEQEAIVSKINEGTEEFLELVNEKYSLQYENLKYIFNYLEEELKIQEQNIVSEQLLEFGFEESMFRNKLIEKIIEELQVYFDAKLLREVALSDFRNISLTYIKDSLVDRRYKSSTKLFEKLNIASEEELERASKVIFFLIRSFYYNNLTFSTLENFIKEELDLSEEKIEQLFDVIDKYKENLERYFLFDQLAILRSSVNELAASIENN